MKKIKRMSALILSCFIILTGCNGGGDPSETTIPEGYITVTDEAGNTVTDEEGNPVIEEENPVDNGLDLVVGFIYPDTIADSTLSVLFDTARLQVEKVLGAETYYIENVLVGQFAEATDLLTQKGCNVIVSCSNKFSNAIKKEAESASEIYFVSFGGTDSRSNLACYQAELFQTAYVCGLAAEYNSSNILGIVGDTSLMNCYGTINGFIQGAKEIAGTDTDIRLNWAWSMADNEVEEAIDDLVSQGCDVVFCATLSNHAVEYCNSIGVKVIGLAYNMPELAPDTYLTGCFYNLNLFLVDALRGYKYTNVTSTVYAEGVAAGAVRLVDFGPACSEGTKDICDALYSLVLSGRASIFTGEIKDNTGKIRVEKGSSLTHDEIWAIEWFDRCVTAINDFTTPVLDPVPSALDIVSTDREVVPFVTTAAETTAPEETAA